MPVFRRHSKVHELCCDQVVLRLGECGILDAVPANDETAFRACNSLKTLLFA